MEGSEVDQDGDTQDPGLSEAPTGVPPATEDDDSLEEGVNESHPNEGDIEEAAD